MEGRLASLKETWQSRCRVSLQATYISPRQMQHDEARLNSRSSPPVDPVQHRRLGMDTCPLERVLGACMLLAPMRQGSLRLSCRVVCFGLTGRAQGAVMVPGVRLQRILAASKDIIRYCVSPTPRRFPALGDDESACPEMAQMSQVETMME